MLTFFDHDNHFKRLNSLKDDLHESDTWTNHDLKVVELYKKYFLLC